MSLQKNNIQLKTCRLFDKFFSGYVKPTTKLNIDQIKKLIVKNKAMLNFLQNLYEETFIARYDDFDDNILATIAKYKHENDEILLYEKSKYFVFETGEYYVKTKEGNSQELKLRCNWIYNSEIDTLYETIENKIKRLEKKLLK